ncbi:MAG: hypothetical protein FOGNACKC_03725 [Anaerolineae bacterium]|nr:hypothetical protein [Anaerolineae bacterium]
MAQDRHFFIEELQSILTHEAGGYRQLVALAQREHEALRQENLVQLSAAVQDKESLLPQLKKWEAAREQLVTRLAGEFHLPASATLSDLIDRLDEAMARKLSALRQEFVTLLEQLLRLNQTNQMMLQAGLVRVDATFGYLASLAAPSNGHYTPRGASQSQSSAGQMLNWEA